MDIGGDNEGVLREFGVSCKVTKATDKFGACRTTTEIKNDCPHPVLENDKLIFMPDVSYVLQNIRNNLTRGQVIYIQDYAVADNNLSSNCISIESIRTRKP